MKSGAAEMLKSLPRLIAHRGGATHAPENTLGALRRCAANRARWVEFDVCLSADGVAVIHHDETLDRTTDGTGPLAGKTLAELRRLDAGSWFAPTFRGERIPTLEEMLATCRGLGLGMNVEIKPIPGYQIETAREALAVIERSGRANDILISSFDLSCLKVAREVRPDIGRGLLLDDLDGPWREQIHELDCVSIHPHHKALTDRDVVRRLLAANMAILVFTVNNRARAAELLDWGVTSVITDDMIALADLSK